MLQRTVLFVVLQYRMVKFVYGNFSATKRDKIPRKTMCNCFGNICKVYMRYYLMKLGAYKLQEFLSGFGVA